MWAPQGRHLVTKLVLSFSFSKHTAFKSLKKPVGCLHEIYTVPSVTRTKNLLRSDFHPEIPHDIPSMDHEIVMFYTFLRVLTILHLSTGPLG